MYLSRGPRTRWTTHDVIFHQFVLDSQACERADNEWVVLQTAAAPSVCLLQRSGSQKGEHMLKSPGPRPDIISTFLVYSKGHCDVFQHETACIRSLCSTAKQCSWEETRWRTSMHHTDSYCSASNISVIPQSWKGSQDKTKHKSWSRSEELQQQRFSFQMYMDGTLASSIGNPVRFQG